MPIAWIPVCETSAKQSIESSNGNCDMPLSHKPFTDLNTQASSHISSNTSITTAGTTAGNTASITAKTMVGATARTMAIQPDHPSVIALKVVSNCDSRRQAGSSILMQFLGIQALGYQATQFHSVCLTHTSNTVFILAHGDPSNRPVLSTGCGLVELIRLSFRNC